MFFGSIYTVDSCLRYMRAYKLIFQRLTHEPEKELNGGNPTTTPLSSVNCSAWANGGCHRCPYKFHFQIRTYGTHGDCPQVQIL